MRAQVLTAFNKPYTFRHDWPDPSPPEGADILVQVSAASYCHTDAVFASGAMAPAQVPRVGCHEFAGNVHALGPDVPAELRDKLAVGTLVGVPVRAYHPCGECAECLDNGGDPEGYSVYCPRAGRMGISVDGGFQEYAHVDSRQVEVIPKPLTATETAPLMCAGLTVFAALQRAQVEIGGGSLERRKIGISGAGGGLGHLGVQFAVNMGWEHVIAIDAVDGPLKLIRYVVDELSPSDAERVTIVDARKEAEQEIVDRLCGKASPGFGGEKGLDAVLILPETQKAFDYAMKLLRNHGVCVTVSFPGGGFNVNAQDLIFRDIKVVGSLIGRNTQLRQMLALAAQKGIRAKSRLFPLEKLNELVDEYHKGNGGKLIIDMMG